MASENTVNKHDNLAFVQAFYFKKIWSLMLLMMLFKKWVAWQCPESLG